MTSSLEKRLKRATDITFVFIVFLAGLHGPKEHFKYASEKDDRITAVGNFIRKIILDELP